MTLYPQARVGDSEGTVFITLLHFVNHDALYEHHERTAGGRQETKGHLVYRNGKCVSFLMIKQITMLALFFFSWFITLNIVSCTIQKDPVVYPFCI